MKILISGNLGFIGSHVTEYFLEQGHEVVGVDAMYDGSNPELENVFREKYRDKYKQLTYDINFLSNPMLCGISGTPDEQYARENRVMTINNYFDVIIHLAAESNVDKSNVYREPFINSNVVGTYSLFKWVQQYNSSAVVVNMETDEVYGETPNPANEYSILKPRNIYSSTKACQAMVAYAYEAMGMDVRSVRPCNIIGKRQAITKLIPRIMDSIQNDKELPVYDGGNATREYIDVRDVPKLFEKIILSPKNFETNELQKSDAGYVKGFNTRINNLTFNQELSIIQVIAVISNIMGKQPKMIDGHRPNMDMVYRLVPSSVCDGHDFIKFEDTIKWILT